MRGDIFGREDARHRSALTNVQLTMASNLAAPPTAGTADNQYFYEDEVFRIDKKGRVKFGLVLENSEAFSSDEEDDFDDILSKGEIRVAWHPEGKEEVLQERVVGLADRTLMPGDVVRRLVPGKDTQRGYCREINMRADVRVVGTKYVVKNVMAERLRPLVRMPRDNAVCLDSWVGSTKCVNEKVVLKSSCGAILEVSDIDLGQLKEANTKFRNGLFADTVFYPGQTVTGRIESLDNVKLLTPSIVLKTNKKGKPIARKFVVQSVYIEGVWVHWQCKALSEDGSDLKAGVLQQPKPYVTGDDLQRLKRLNLFESCMLQINDKNYLKITDCDVIVRKSLWEKEQAIKYKLLLSQQQKEENQSKNTKAPLQGDKIKIKLSNTTLESDRKLKSSNNSNACPKIVKNVNVDTTSRKERKETENMDGKDAHANKTCDNKGEVADLIDDWQTDEEEEDVDENSIADSSTTISTCSSPTPKSSPKRSPLLHKKQVKRLKKSAQTADKMPAVGDEIVTEALVVYSTATVVWQDGTVESGIPSTQLYPIHHLDDHEFFPGDFVLSGVEGADVSFRDYGVIQIVDHQGRTARVKWFTTYTSTDEPKPNYTGETEVSVYDLKDHPDFQYRPGTIVIRVANFVGEDATCTAGQIIDNYIDGRVKVWWVDGHISMCWPQDLFEVGQYDADNNFWGNNESDNDSWETESEVSEPGGIPQKSISEPQLSANLERARVAMARLEEIFIINPNLQNHEVMRKLLAVYKKCRYLDRLMNTSFFHEDHFMGLLEPVKKGGNQTKAERAQDQKNRLFNQSPNSKLNSSNNAQNNLSISESTAQVKDYSAKVILNLTSTPYKCVKKKTSKPDLQIGSQDAVDTLNANPKEMKLSNTEIVTSASLNAKNSLTIIQSNNSDLKNISCSYENKLLSCVISNIDKATQETEDLNKFNEKSSKQKTNISQEDSGNYSRNENCDGSSTSYASSNDLTNEANMSQLKVADDQKSISCSSIELTDDTPEYVCARLCALLKAQLVKALQEIQQKYCKDNLNLSEVVEYDVEEKTLEDLPVAIAICDEPQSPVETPVEETEKQVTTPLVLAVPLECFQVLETAPSTHKFHLTIFHPANPQQYYKAVRREHKLLRNSLPPGVWVRVFEDRMDLVSVMIEGPKKTPYEDGMFFFDIQLGREYPKMPPLCYYISYCSDRLNPNLYEDGKVCVSLLGTWSGRDSEVWGSNSTLLQVIVSIQGLILVSEPYFNEAGYEKQKGTQQGKENSRMYNEMVIIKLVQSMTKLISSPPDIFRDQIILHFKERGKTMYERIKGWMDYSQLQETSQDKLNTSPESFTPPEFPLVPASRGFCLTLAGLLDNFYRKLKAITE